MKKYTDLLFSCTPYLCALIVLICYFIQKDIFLLYTVFLICVYCLLCFGVKLYKKDFFESYFLSSSQRKSHLIFMLFMLFCILPFLIIIHLSNAKNFLSHIFLIIFIFFPQNIPLCAKLCEIRFKSYLKKYNIKIISPMAYDISTSYLKLNNTHSDTIKFFQISDNTPNPTTIITDGLKSMHTNFQKYCIYTVTVNFAFFLCYFTCFTAYKLCVFTPFLTAITPFILFLPQTLIFALETASENTNFKSLQDTFSLIALDGLLLFLCSFIVFLISLTAFSLTCAQFAAFDTFILSSIMYTLNLRSNKSVFLFGIFKNKLINFLFFTTLCAVIIFSAFLHKDINLTPHTLLLICAMSIVPFAVMQIQKVCAEIFK